MKLKNGQAWRILRTNWDANGPRKVALPGIRRYTGPHRASLTGGAEPNGKSRMRNVGLLLLLVAVDLLLVYSLRSFGWQSTVLATVLTTTLAAFVASVAVGIILVRRWHRNRWQFRLSTLLLVFVAISVFLGTVGVELYRFPMERYNATQLRRSGAEVYTTSRDPIPERDGWLGKLDGWLRKVGGEIAAAPKDADVVEIDFGSDRSLREGIDSINRMPNVNNLCLAGPGITDSGLAALLGLGERRSDLAVDILSTSITDRGLRHLQACQDLSVLCLNGGNITDNGLVHLRSMSHLRRLLLVAEGPNARRKRITDQGLAVLGTLQQLESLTILGFDITDDGLSELTSLKNLKVLYLMYTQVTEEGIAQLRTALPNCKITARYREPLSNASQRGSQ